mgnify:CR=1 FL=1
MRAGSKEEKIVIEISHLVKKYGDHIAVNDLTLTVEPGKIYGFLGPNGAGKSTTMNIITGYLGATSGEVKINGFDIFAQPEEAKGFSVETTFNDDIVSVEQVLPILLEQCDIVATRMRRKEKKCTSVSVTFRTLDFKNKSHQTTFATATDLTDEIYKNAKRLFVESWKGEPLRLIGVALTNNSTPRFLTLPKFIFCAV